MYVTYFSKLNLESAKTDFFFSLSIFQVCLIVLYLDTFFLSRKLEISGLSKIGQPKNIGRSNQMTIKLEQDVCMYAKEIDINAYLGRVIHRNTLPLSSFSLYRFESPMHEVADLRQSKLLAGIPQET